ncbi:hypothetical protein [Paenibacillus sanguinis]|uniref:hypothetical protein n=1 Tax=Paenibacillus sanguinis TaxID=225906 RepID=UPI00038069D4|nr:hypothetical protein [Paenibacillus sanguinis]
MAKSKSKPISLPFATPPDPNLSFVAFPTILTAGTAAVSLQSLVHQVNKQPYDRRITEIMYNPSTLRMEIKYEV